MVALEDFLAFAAEVMGVPVSTLSAETAYESIPAWDSVMHVRLVMEISERYGVDIPLERVPGIRTLGDFWSFVKG